MVIANNCLETKRNFFGNSKQHNGHKKTPLREFFYVFAIKASTFFTMFLEPINMGTR